MAYRSSHYRKGYLRRTPSGGYTWVSPTHVSGCSYTPGLHGFTSQTDYSHIVHKNSNEFSENRFEHKNAIDQIIELFKMLDSEERKYCLDALEVIDSQMDADILNQLDKSDSKCSTDYFKISEGTDGNLLIKQFIGFDETEVTVPSSYNGKKITSIATEAFLGCNQLRNIIIPAGLTQIGNSAFKGCSHLQNIMIPDTVTYIGENCFDDCEELKKAILPYNLKTIPSCAFSGCIALTYVQFPKKLEKIENCAFSRCKKLMNLQLPETLKEIGRRAFYDCDFLRNVFLPDGIQKLGEEAFSTSNFMASSIRIRMPSSLVQISENFGNFETVIGSKTYRRVKESVIICKAGSFAQQYARKYGIQCEMDLT